TSLNTLAPCGRGQGEGSKSLHKTLSRICKFAYCSLTNSTLSQRERVRSRVDFSLPEKRDCHVHSVQLVMTKAFTLAEVLITLGIIGIVAAMTMPALFSKQQEKHLVSGVLKFYSTLSQAVDLLIARNDGADISTIIYDFLDSDATAFDNIAKEMKIIDKCTRAKCYSVQWLPDYALTYSGENKGNQYGISKQVSGDVCYLLADGTTFCLDITPGLYCVTVDVNGKKKPNRVGRDIFSFSVGYRGKKVTPDEAHVNHGNVLTSIDTSYNCSNPLNLDPEKGGVCPTSYVLLTKKLPPEYNKKK
ncbi:type II secretion system protein, partial [bacterium]|nr:type II secretion system protein [bacterium]